MKCFVLNLKDEFAGLKTEQNPTLTCYISDNFKEIDEQRAKPAVLVLPGGGYCFCSEREGEPIALNYLSKGFNVFVLRYSVSPIGYPEQLLEASAAIALIRRNAKAWHIDANAIATIGFSAGGHLSGSIGTLWNQPFIAQTLDLQPEENKPNAIILCYAVVTNDKQYGHMGSFDALLEYKENKALLELLSLENSVGAHTPPTFLWHTTDDNVVPVENSLLFAMALSKFEIPYEMHIYPSGVHGLANCNSTTAAPNAPSLVNTTCEGWVDLSIKWLKNLFI